MGRRVNTHNRDILRTFPSGKSSTSDCASMKSYVLGDPAMNLKGFGVRDTPTWSSEVIGETIVEAYMACSVEMQYLVTTK